MHSLIYEVHTGDKEKKKVLSPESGFKFRKCREKVIIKKVFI